jgi:hypothetical protein
MFNVPQNGSMQYGTVSELSLFYGIVSETMQHVPNIPCSGIVCSKRHSLLVTPSLNASKVKITLLTTTKLEKPSLKLFRNLMKIRSRHIKKPKEPMPFNL